MQTPGVDCAAGDAWLKKERPGIQKMPRRDHSAAAIGLKL
jgi:hypothetical protein